MWGVTHPAGLRIPQPLRCRLSLLGEKWESNIGGGCPPSCKMPWEASGGGAGLGLWAEEGEGAGSTTWGKTPNQL